MLYYDDFVTNLVYNEDYHLQICYFLQKLLIMEDDHDRSSGYD